MPLVDSVEGKELIKLRKAMIDYTAKATWKPRQTGKVEEEEVPEKHVLVPSID